MKKIILLSLTILTTLVLNAQLKITEKADINWGEELRFKKGEEFIEYLGQDSKKHFLIKSLKRGYQYEIDVFGNDMTLKSKVIIDMKHHGNYKMDYEGTYLIRVH